MTEVRDDKQGLKNSPKGENKQQGASNDEAKKGALEHGHGKNRSTEGEARSDKTAGKSVKP